jgi:hypothetical protein
MQFELIIRDDRKVDIDVSATAETSVNNENKIFRFKFTDSFANELYAFSKIHQYDDRLTFKDAWEVWTKEKSEMVDQEVRRLSTIGYDGDILEKMFKSARYYFRKKPSNKKEPVKRRSYINVPKELLLAMDKHITDNINKDDYKPKDGFDDFCTSNTDILKEGIAKICKDGITEPTVIHEKMKKTYKNRYFMIANK